MPHYTTGEMAKLCGVSVRTVQFYDTKEVLRPSALTDGGRRLYSEDDVKQMKLICLLKSLGLSLTAIKDILSSESPAKVLTLLLEEQARQIGGEIEERKQQLRLISAVQESIRDNSAIPLQSISGIEQMMKDKKALRKTHLTMLAVGLVMTAIQAATLTLAITRAIWWPFAAGMAVVIFLGVMVTGMYYGSVAYICPECNARFRPTLPRFLFSNHTPKTRKLTCPNGHTGFCVETPANQTPP